MGGVFEDREDFFSEFFGGEVLAEVVDALFGPVAEEVAGVFVSGVGFVVDLQVPGGGGGEAEGLRKFAAGADQEPAGFVEGDLCGELRQEFDAAVVDEFEGGDGIAGVESAFDGEFQRLRGLEEVAGEFVVGGDSEERAVGDEEATGTDGGPPVFPSEFLSVLEFHVHAVVADGVGEDAGGAAGGGGNAKARVEGVVVDFLSPEGVAEGFGEFFEVAGFAPGFAAGVHAAAGHVIVGDADGVELAGAEPEGVIPPEGFFGIDPGVFFLGVVEPFH